MAALDGHRERTAADTLRRRHGHFVRSEITRGLFGVLGFCRSIPARTQRAPHTRRETLNSPGYRRKYVSEIVNDRRGRRDSWRVEHHGCCGLRGPFSIASTALKRRCMASAPPAPVVQPKFLCCTVDNGPTPAGTRMRKNELGSWPLLQYPVDCLDQRIKVVGTVVALPVYKKCWGSINAAADSTRKIRFDTGLKFLRLQGFV